MIPTRRLLLAALAAAPVVARAQSDGRPVRIVIGFPPGGGIDSVARVMAPRLSEALKQPVIVENKPGANGLLAMESVAKSAADGTTLFIGTSGNLAMTGAFYPNAPVRIERDFVPVAQVASLPFLLVANPSVPAASVAELVAYAKTRPGQLNYSSSGNGSTLHLAGELFNEMAGIKATHIGYKGSAPSIADLVGGHVQWAFDAPSLTMPHVKAGRLRAIGHTAATRLPSLPDIAPIAETLPGYEVLNWYGVVAPTGTPAETVRRLGDAIRTAMSDAEVRSRVAALGIDPVATSPDEFRRFMDAETTKWTQVIRRGNISAN
ncbi:MAG: tripartite tricarboxylate transporter substrate binding protein [Burkholderiales bacterium]|nr:tripartite tricarboxylate transporter substrate binding protein [Burkholderiales bacterium]